MALFSAGPVNEVQKLTPGTDITGGTWTITFDGQTTTAIAYNANAATVQAALEALSNIAPGDVVVTGGDLTTAPFLLTFGGAYVGIDVPLVSVGTISLTGTDKSVTPSTVHEGGTITDLPVNDQGGGYEPFVYENYRVRTRLLGDGSGSAAEVIQGSGAKGYRIARVGARTTNAAVLATLQAWFEKGTQFVFTDCDGYAPTVLIFEYTPRRGRVGQHFYQMTLLEMVAP